MTSSRRRLGKGDYQLLADFRYVLRQFLSFSEEATTRVGLAPQQHQALLAIKGAGGKMSIGDLAQRLLVRPHSAVGLVDRLVEAKLLQRDTDQKRSPPRSFELNANCRKRAKITDRRASRRTQSSCANP